MTFPFSWPDLVNVLMGKATSLDAPKCFHTCLPRLVLSSDCLTYYYCNYYLTCVLPQYVAPTPLLSFLFALALRTATNVVKWRFRNHE